MNGPKPPPDPPSPPPPPPLPGDDGTIYGDSPDDRRAIAQAEIDGIIERRKGTGDRSAGPPRGIRD